MAILYGATISPRKDELIAPWLRTQTWWDGEDERGPVGTFRLDDPAGEVGIECFLFGSAVGSTLFVPVTYRGAPIPERDQSLVGVMEHSVLGTRYVYDACADPVFVASVLDTIRFGGREVDLRLRRADGTEIIRDPSATARGEGGPTVPTHDPATLVTSTGRADCTTVVGSGFELVVMRRLGQAPPGPALIGRFAGGADLRLVVVVA